MRRFKNPDRYQLNLLPPSLEDLVRQDHPVRFILKFVESCDLSNFYRTYQGDGSGAPPYDPAMMVAVLLYAYVRGIPSSRKIERALEDDLGFRFIVGELRPDHDTIAFFRHRHQEGLKGLFQQAVSLAMKRFAVSLNLVAIDGTKMRASTSKKSLRTEAELNAEIAAINGQLNHYFKTANEEDKVEDEEFGKVRNGYFLPSELATDEALEEFIKQGIREYQEEQNKQNDEENKRNLPPSGGSKSESKYEAKLRRRAERLKQAKKALDEKERKRKEEDPTGKRQRDIERQRGKPYIATINVTDPDSRLMVFAEGGYRDAYNGQIVVDADNGMIVAADLTQDANDIRQLEPMTRQVERNTGFRPANLAGDVGYCNFAQIERLKSVECFIPPKRRAPGESTDSKAERMREKLVTPLGKMLYAQRQAIVEPVFGAIKFARKMGRFLTVGLKMASTEWMLICTAHNLMKLINLKVQPV